MEIGEDYVKNGQVLQSLSICFVYTDIGGLLKVIERDQLNFILKVDQIPAGHLISTIHRMCTGRPFSYCRKETVSLLAAKNGCFYSL